MRKTALLALGCLICSLALQAAAPKQKMAKFIQKEMDFAVLQSMRMYDTVRDLDGRLVNTTKNGVLETCDSKNWVAGFFPGTLWYLYEYTGDPAILAAAERMTERMAPEQYNRDNHDVGFMVYCSYGNGWRLTGRDDYRQVIVNAGNSLSTRFSPSVGCTRSWNPQPSKQRDFIVIVDNMMNLELLTVTASLTGEAKFMDMARTHANTTIRNHYRPDYSSFHVVNYDEMTGEILSKETEQGYADGSAWSRGQAWGLYGFTMMYRQTRDPRYLEQAVNIGKFLMNHPALPKDKIPYWDLDVPVGKDTPRDASSACIMASALIELSTFTEDPVLSQQFLTLAEQQLTSLSKAPYKAKLGENANFILKHSTANKPANTFDTPLVYADYYYIEALLRYKRLLEGRPVVDVRTVVSDQPDRQLWISTLDRIARPVLTNLAAGTLKRNLPFESLSSDPDRKEVSRLEAFGRTVCGIAPWLELGPNGSLEGQLRAEFIDLTVRALANSVDPAGPDRLVYDGSHGGQALVDAAFLAQGLLSAPSLWTKLSARAQENLTAALVSSREITPGESNWLLFASTVEAALLKFTGSCDVERLLYGVDRFLFFHWYKGDAWYGDGMEFHLDYYNSLVIHPMLTDVLRELQGHEVAEMIYLPQQLRRESRFAAQLERLISPEGTYPAVGRSITYRFGSFHALAHTALLHNLPDGLPPEQVRCALSAVIRRQLATPGNFDRDGWLTVGFSGHQPNMSEPYINTGSEYLCCAVFLPLGLPADDPFWAAPALDWSQKKAWQGIDIGADHALGDLNVIPQKDLLQQN